MMIVITLLVAGFVTKSLESCPEDFCATVWSGKVGEPQGVESVPLGEDKESGCVCRQIPKISTLCFGRATCRFFPKNLNVTTTVFWLKSSQVLEIRPKDLAKMTHLEVLNIEGNYNLTRVKTGSFLNMINLKNMSISYNANLGVLEKGCFEGLVNLRRLYLNKNAFVQLSEVVPALENLPRLIKLELSENSFNKIQDRDFQGLQNSSLTELNLILCQIEDIEPKALNPLTNLSTLRLGENNFNATSFAKVIEETINKVPLTVLNLYSVGLRKSTSKELLAAIAKTKITRLNLARNQFEIINSGTFPKMPNLEILDLREMLILNVTNDAFVGFPNLKTLRLNGNKLASIPEGVLLEQLTYLDLQQNSGNRFSSSYFSIYGRIFVNMKNLQQLNLSFNAIHAIYNSSFVGLENLRILGLKNATIYHIYNGTFAMLSNLIFLNLEDNLFAKLYPLDLEGLFEGLINLKILLLGGCGISFISKDASPFKNLKKLEHLGLERNSLKTLPNFEVLVNLQRIDLSQNGLQPWSDLIFSKNHQLKEVLVSDNKFAYLTAAMLHDFHNLTKLDLRNNPFTCDCSFSWNDANIMSLISNQKVLCAFPETTTSLTVKEFLQKENHCQNLTLIVPSIILAFCLLATLFSLYYFRWHLRYWIFLTRLHLSRNQKIRHSNENQGYNNYIYDAFVSYSNEDQNFVIRLVTMLENYPPFLKLCVYERDFEVGTMISENVLESVAKSRKTLLVISNSYAKSQWCRWESQIAEHHRLFFQNENGEYVDDSLILIKLGPVNDVHMTPTLKYLLKTRIYLPWDVDVKKQKVFWEKLRDALTPPLEINENTYL